MVAHFHKKVSGYSRIDSSSILESRINVRGLFAAAHSIQCPLAINKAVTGVVIIFKHLFWLLT